MDQAHGSICLPDGQGGATLKETRAAELTLGVSGLRALAVEDCRALERLDLSACADLSWLAVSGCPGLRVIVLPGQGEGVEIHVDFGAATPVLQVHGAVRDFDCCWDGGALAAPRGRQQRGVLSDAYVGASLEMVRRTAGLAMLVRYDGSEKCLRLDGPRELVLAQTRHAAEIRLGPGVEASEIHGLPGLARIVSAGAALLRIGGCPRLRAIEGDGRTLGVTDSAAFWPLAIRGRWEGATVRASAPFGLSAPGVACLHAPAHARGAVTPEAIGHLTAQARAGDAAARHVLLEWCRSAQEPTATLFALQALEALAEGGARPANLWEIRCLLHGRNRPPGSLWRKRAAPWHWDLPRDLADRGWAADLNLWLICRRAGQQASLGALGAPRHLATVMAALGQTRCAGDEARLLALLDEFWAGSDPWLAASGGPEDRALLLRVVRDLVAVRNRACAALILQGLLAWLRGRRNSEERIAVLAALHLAGCDAATRSMVQMSDEPDIGSEQRSRALLIAFLPRRSEALSHLAVASPPLGFHP